MKSQIETSVSLHGRSRHFGSRPTPSSESESHSQRKTKESAAWQTESKTSRRPTGRSIVLHLPATDDRDGRGIPEHEVGLSVNPTVNILKRSRGQNTPHGLRVTTLDEHISDKGAPFTEQRSLAMELQANFSICSTGHPEQIIQGTGGVRHYKKKREENYD